MELITFETFEAVSFVLSASLFLYLALRLFYYGIDKVFVKKKPLRGISG